jgi:glycosyltransferase involved in cell wall biosynthesis
LRDAGSRQSKSARHPRLDQRDIIVRRVCIYFRTAPEQDRWLPGDRFIRPFVRRLVRGQSARGPGKVFTNLCLGLDRLGVGYEINLPFARLRDDDLVGVIGLGHRALSGYDRPFPIVAGPGLMTHPSEWPDLCERYPVVRYLQHSAWANAVYKPYYGDKCAIWPVGIDTDSWAPVDLGDKKFDFLIYDKIMWRQEEMVPRLLAPIRSELQRRKLTFTEIRYGHYGEAQYRQALQLCRAMLFLCEHESQGLAYQECLAAGVPVLAWDQGRWLDPNRFAWGDADVPATSVPYFDESCGVRFGNIEEFGARLSEFLDRRAAMSPRDYILRNLTLERCSGHYLQILEGVRDVAKPSAIRTG